MGYVTNILLLIAMFLAYASGDENCFYHKMSQCFMQSMGQTTPFVLPVDFSLCEYRKQLFTCLEKKLVKCSVEQKYDFSELEKLYHDICTEGTEIYKQMKEHSGCYKDAILNPSTCTQSIVDFIDKAEGTGPELIDDINKKVCKEGRHIVHCYYGVIEEKCGKSAKDFVETVFRASENLNKAFCEDILNKKIIATFF